MRSYPRLSSVGYAAATVFALVALAGGLSAAAHAELVAMQPEAGALLRASPSEIRLTFNSALNPGSSLLLYAEGFLPIANVVVLIEQNQLVANLPMMEAGTYTVQWNVISGDGHEAMGSYSFRITPRAAVPIPTLLGALIFIVLLIVVLRRNRAG